MTTNQTDQGGSGAGATVEVDYQAFARWWLSPHMRASLPLSQQSGAAAAWQERGKEITHLRAALEAAQGELSELKTEHTQFGNEAQVYYRNRYLQAENTRLTRELEATREAIEQTWRPEVAALRARISQLELRPCAERCDDHCVASDSALDAAQAAGASEKP